MDDLIATEPLRIVVANDDIGYLEMMQEVLSEFGHDVSTCLTIDEAYQRIRDFGPQVVIVDLLFPGTKQGIDLITMMRLGRETEHIPVIICSAATKALREMEDHLQAKRLTTLYKPFNLDELVGAIQQAWGSGGAPN